MFLATCPFLMAQRAGDKEIVDIRLEGYATDVTLPAGTTAMTWLLLVFLTLLCIGALFKNARRTHLD